MERCVLMAKRSKMSEKVSDFRVESGSKRARLLCRPQKFDFLNGLCCGIQQHHALLERK